ncbi:MAG: DUF3267 domain-containing protein [Solobacterium sp.]|nr:DUF3267 domain-containing protein [Solobacterium sp.]
MKDQAHEKEKQRKLSPAEQRRMDRFTGICTELEKQGYTRTELTIGIVWANIFSIILAIPVFAAGILLFIRIHPGSPLSFSGISFLVFWIAVLILVVVHELIHGITWSFSAKNGFKDNEFGFMKEYLTPYCTCTTPLPEGGYIAGALMPCILLGILPSIAAIVLGNGLMLFIGMVMIVAASGDILIVAELLKHRFSGRSPLIYDHPTQAGCVIFEQGE